MAAIQRLLVIIVVLFCALTSVHADTTEAKTVKTDLDNGATVICRQEADTPLIAIQVFVRVGAAQERTETAGLGTFVARTLLASTTSRGPETMAQDIGALGGNVNVTWQADWTQVGVLTVSDKYKDAASLVADVLANADFDSEAVEDTRKQMLSDIDAGDADLFQTAYKAMRGTLYRGSGYALPALGTSGSIKRINRSDLQAYFNRYFIPRNFVFVIVGNIDPQAATQEIAQDLDGFPTAGRGTQRAEMLPTPPSPLTHDPDPVRIYQADLAETCIMVGYRVPSISSDDYPAMLVLNALLGGMKTSRLFTNLREKQSLAYELGSAYSAQRIASDMVGYVFASPTKTDPTTQKSVSTIGLIKQQMLLQFESFKAIPVTSAELQHAQHFVIGSYKIKHERIEDRAGLLGVAAVTRSPEGYLFDTNYADYINKVTAADVQHVAAKYFNHPAITTIEPAADSDGVLSE